MPLPVRPISRRVAPRIALFTHDTFGLGHVRRCLHIVRGLAERLPNASFLIVSGSPALSVFDELPDRADYVKVPTIAKTGSRKLTPPHVRLPLAELSALRSQLILDAVTGFQPDVFMVDNFPLGSQGELMRVLQVLCGCDTRTVLGLRDILDSPEKVRADWKRQGVYDVLDRYYDRILIYGSPEILEVVEAYELPSGVAQKVSYCGYVTDDGLTAESATPNGEFGVTEPFLLVTGGGGGDGFPLLKTFLQAIPLLPAMPSVVVTGPLMKESLREKLRTAINGNANVVLRDYVPNLRRHLGRAAVVVSMCGYNTAAEIVASGARAVVVPRTWRYGEHVRGEAAGVEGEQLMRARALAQLGFVEVLEPAQLTADRLAGQINRCLTRTDHQPTPSVKLSGLSTVTESILALLGGGDA